jgi:hypothetical protein
MMMLVSVLVPGFRMDVDAPAAQHGVGGQPASRIAEKLIHFNGRIRVFSYDVAPNAISGFNPCRMNRKPWVIKKGKRMNFSRDTLHLKPKPQNQTRYLSRNCN